MLLKYITFAMPVLKDEDALVSSLKTSPLDVVAGLRQTAEAIRRSSHQNRQEVGTLMLAEVGVVDADDIKPRYLLRSGVEANFTEIPSTNSSGRVVYPFRTMDLYISETPHHMEKVIQFMLAKSMWFVVTPYPSGLVKITIKDENVFAVSRMVDAQKDKAAATRDA